MAAMRRAVSGRWSLPAVWGGDQGPGLAPEGVLRRQGLRIGHVQSGPPQAAGLQHLRQGGAVHRASPAAVEENGVLFQAQQPLPAEQAYCFRRLGQGQGHHVGPGQQLVQLREAIYALDALGGAGGITAHAGGMGPQGPAQPGEGGAQIPGTHHQHLRVQQGTGLAQVPPLGLPLLVPVLGQALHEGEQHGKQMLRH